MSSDVVASVSIDSPSNSQQDALFHCIAYDYSCANWDRLWDHLRDVPWEDILKLSASAAASEFFEWVQVGIDASSLIHLHSFELPELHRNHFFCLYQLNKFSEPKIKFRQVSNCCKSVIEAAKLAHANKRKKSITSQELGSPDFWQIATSILNKGKFAIPHLFNSLEVLPSTSAKENLFAGNFSRNFNLDDSGIFNCFPS